MFIRTPFLFFHWTVPSCRGAPVSQQERFWLCAAASGRRAILAAAQGRAWLFGAFRMPRASASSSSWGTSMPVLASTLGGCISNGANSGAGGLVGSGSQTGRRLPCATASFRILCSLCYQVALGKGARRPRAEVAFFIGSS